jgi:hypothetical protein
LISLGFACYGAYRVVRLINAEREKTRAKIQLAWADRISYSKFSDADKSWLTNTVIPQLADFAVAGSSSSFRFYRLNKLAIAMNYLPVTVSAITLVVWKEYAAWGLAIIAVFGSIAAIVIAFDGIEQNALRWQDAEYIKWRLEDAINELLTETPDIPLNKQVDRLSLEYRQIMQLANELKQKRIGKAQESADSVKEQVAQQIDSERKQYREKYQNDSNSNPVSTSPSSISDPLFMVPTQHSDNLGGDRTSEGRGNAVVPAIAPPEVSPVELMSPIEPSDWPQWQAQQLDKAKENEDDEPISEAW